MLFFLHLRRLLAYPGTVYFDSRTCKLQIIRDAQLIYLKALAERTRSIDQLENNRRIMKKLELKNVD